MPPALRRFVLLLAFPSLHAAAQIAVPQFQPRLQQTTPELHHARLQSLHDLVITCRQDSKACNPSAVGDDEQVQSPSETYQVRWQWLRELLNTSRNPFAPDRTAQLDQAAARLDQELNSPSDQQAIPSQADFTHARAAANSVLTRPEFRIVGRESLWDREVAAFFSWLNRLFSATSSFGRRSPWLAPLLEWSFVGLIVAVVLVWVARTMQRQRVALLLSGSLPAADWQKESAQWADLARTEADAGNWREAIHCLYWASIVVLESRRLWRRDYTRTPREYLRLLELNSPRHSALRTLTSIFERIWYGLRPAAHEDYLQALALFEDLRRA